jgi:rhodanese-related sulfurtransferase
MRLWMALAVAALMIPGAIDFVPGGIFNAGASALTELEGGKYQITAQELKKRLDKGKQTIIIDARSQLDGQIIKSAVHVPPTRLEEWAKSANKDAFIVTYCTCPHDEAAENATSRLREMGFRNVFTLSGGLDAARAAGIEVVKTEDR